MASLTQNQSVLSWIDEKAELVKPDKIVWIDGSEEQIEALRAEACSTGELIKLNEELLPDCYYHRTAVNDVARVEDRTLICTKKEEDAGPTNHWMDPEKAYKMLYDIARDSYKGRTMYVIPYSMGPVGSPLAKIGIELTDSIYVVLNMCIMTRVGKKVLDVLGDSNDWVRGLHCKCAIDAENRWICQFPEDNTIISVNSGYGGNVLLGKKCFALRIASYQGKNEGWQAEHMLILGIENPQGEVKYICAAFPSACGKTNLAMLIPPEGYRKKGYKVWCVGDDISWIRKGEDGRLYAINPENGFFGVAPGTNDHSNPNALASTKKGTIFTNVARNLDDNTVWWEGLDKNPPVNAEEWTGKKVNGPEWKAEGKNLAHPNSRFTAPAVNCPCISSEFENPQGVADLRIRVRRQTRKARTAGVSVPRLEPWRVRRLHHGVRDHRCGGRCGRRGAPRPDGDVAFLRLQHGRLLEALDRHRQDARSRQGPPRSSTSTGSARTTRATSCGRASATTFACSNGS